LCVYVCMHMCVGMFVCVRVCICVYVYVCICVGIHENLMLISHVMKQYQQLLAFRLHITQVNRLLSNSAQWLFSYHLNVTSNYTGF